MCKFTRLADELLVNSWSCSVSTAAAKGTRAWRARTARWERCGIGWPPGCLSPSTEPPRRRRPYPGAPEGAGLLRPAQACRRTSVPDASPGTIASQGGSRRPAGRLQAEVHQSESWKTTWPRTSAFAEYSDGMFGNPGPGRAPGCAAETHCRSYPYRSRPGDGGREGVAMRRSSWKRRPTGTDGPGHTTEPARRIPPARSGPSGGCPGRRQGVKQALPLPRVGQVLEAIHTLAEQGKGIIFQADVRQSRLRPLEGPPSHWSAKRCRGPSAGEQFQQWSSVDDSFSFMPGRPVRLGVRADRARSASAPRGRWR